MDPEIATIVAELGAAIREDDTERGAAAVEKLAAGALTDLRRIANALEAIAVDRITREALAANAA